MKPRKKNKFITFILSLIPGAAEMYMGFMKSGLSLLVLFVLPIMITGVLYAGDYFAVISGIIYVVSFLHARNIATAPEEDFHTFEDRFFWEEIMDIKASDVLKKSYTKWTAIAFIFVGACGIWSLFRENLFRAIAGLSDQNKQMIRGIVDSVPRLAFSVLIIAIGVMLIRGKKKELIEENGDGIEEK